MSLTLRQNCLPSSDAVDDRGGEPVVACSGFGLGFGSGLPAPDRRASPARWRSERNSRKHNIARPRSWRPVTNANGRSHDDVTAFTAYIDVGLCQRTRAVGHRPVWVPFENDVVSTARRKLGVRGHVFAVLVLYEEIIPDPATVGFSGFFRRIEIDRPDAGSRSRWHPDHDLRPIAPPAADRLLVGCRDVKTAREKRRLVRRPARKHGPARRA